MNDDDGDLLYARQGNREGEVKRATVFHAFNGGDGDWVAVLRLRGDVLSAKRHVFQHDANRVVMDWVQLGKR
jgi:hypothetical protein